MKKPDGGPAFPGGSDYRDLNYNLIEGTFSGMTLRDWFAGQWLTGWMANSKVVPPGTTLAIVAKSAYEVADAMLTERERES